jgi:predicted esterase YcpF (UPF0227 family)
MVFNGVMTTKNNELMVKILYVHGYNGKPDGESFQKLAKYAEVADFGGENVEMHSFDYDASDPFNALRDLRMYYFENDIDLIIGSSLGGFLAANCDFMRRIVINPCWAPSEELPKIGYEGETRKYTLLEEDLGHYAERGDADLCIGCFAPADELLGTKYKEAFSKHFKETYEIPGGHHLSDEAARKIMTEIAPMAIKKFKESTGPGKLVSNGLSEFERIQHAHMYSIYNESSIKKSHMCGCFYCGKVFPSELVEDFAIEFSENGDTGICPYCMIDSVLAGADWKDLSPEFLKKMKEYWF